MNKYLLVLATLSLFSLSAFSADLVKRCEVNLPAMEAGDIDIKMDIKVFKQDGILSSTIVQTVDGVSVPLDSSAEMISYEIREGLKANLESEDLNQGEKLIVHAMTVEADKDLSKIFSSGIKNLKLIRKVNAYVIDEETNMGSATIVEAMDKKGKIIGSFLGGFVVRPCR